MCEVVEEVVLEVKSVLICLDEVYVFYVDFDVDFDKLVVE